MLGDSAGLAGKYCVGHSASAGRASQRRIWKGQWIRAVGTIDLDLEIPGGDIMSAAGWQACASLAHCLDFPSAVCTGGGGRGPGLRLFLFIFFLLHFPPIQEQACGRQGTTEVVDTFVILSK